MANNKGTYIEADKCSFCGLPITEVGVLFSGADGAAICDQCIERGYETLMDRQMAEEQLLREETKLQREDLMKPAEIKEFLDQYVIGQDDAKKTLAVAVYNHYKRLMHAEAETRKEDEVEIDKSNIIMVGETGTGKELVAESIHTASKRAGRRFVAQNCAAIPGNLLESILFGTKKGSYTGAENKPGLFEIANGGTLFLDEINSMEMNVQAKILKAIEEKQVVRLGGYEPIKTDIKVISAVNERPMDCVKAGKLREDLFYRLSVVQVNIPPLRERRDDILYMASRFIEEYNQSMQRDIMGLDEQVEELFRSYAWPGNVRELKNIIEGAFNVASTRFIQKKDLPEYLANPVWLEVPREATEALAAGRVKAGEGAGNAFAADESDTKRFGESGWPEDISFAGKTLNQTLAEVEERMIRNALREADSLAGAARLLGITKQNLHYKLTKYKIK